MRGRLSEIDLLRGYAVALVVFLHLNLSNPFRGPAIQAVLDNTEMATGVDLFFAISGFVICRALVDLWRVETASQAWQLRNSALVFYRRRFARLWPAAAFWLSLNVVLAGLFAGEGYWPPLRAVLIKAVLGFVYLYNFQEARAPGPLGYFWSLSLEWQFYLVLPLFLLIIRPDAWRVAGLLVVLLVAAWLKPGGAGWQFFRLDGLILGIIAYVLLGRLDLSVPQLDRFTRPVPRHLGTLVLLAAMVLVPRAVANFRLGYVLASALATVLVGLAALDRGYVSSFGVRPLVAWLGSRSYSIYLAHLPVILSVLSLYQLLITRFGLRRPPDQSIWYYAVNLALIPVAAELTYRLLEVPSHRRSRQIGAAAAGSAVDRPRPLP